jgi:hypothetical protein
MIISTIVAVMTWPEAVFGIVAIAIAIAGGLCFFGIMVTEKWPWEK